MIDARRNLFFLLFLPPLLLVCSPTCISDRNHLCLWRHVLRQNTHYAGNKGGPRGYSPRCSGKHSVAHHPQFFIFVVSLSVDVLQSSRTRAVSDLIVRLVYGNIQRRRVRFASHTGERMSPCPLHYRYHAHRAQASKLPVRENDVGMVFVANLTTERIASVEEFDALYAYVLRPCTEPLLTEVILDARRRIGLLAPPI
jgi:hypothetical protein